MDTGKKFSLFVNTFFMPWSTWQIEAYTLTFSIGKESEPADKDIY